MRKRAESPPSSEEELRGMSMGAGRRQRALEENESNYPHLRRLLASPKVTAAGTESTRRMPSFGKEKEYLRGRTIDDKGSKSAVRVTTTPTKRRRKTRRGPVELSQGGDVTSSQERRHGELILNETSGDEGSDDGEESREDDGSSSEDASFTSCRSQLEKAAKPSRVVLVPETSSEEEDEIKKPASGESRFGTTGRM